MVSNPKIDLPNKRNEPVGDLWDGTLEAPSRQTVESNLHHAQDPFIWALLRFLWYSRASHRHHPNRVTRGIQDIGNHLIEVGNG
jgi:hypothetical protein